MIDRSQRNESKGKLIGLGLTVALHAAAVCLVSFNGFTYIYPPPQEKSILIDFEQETPEILRSKKGLQPQATEIDKQQKVQLVQKSESSVEADRQNLTPETKSDDFGDVSTQTPKEEPKLDPRAAFPGMAKRDTSLTAEHAAQKATDNNKAGQVSGNTRSARSDGKPNAHLEGRRLIGQLPHPAYNVQESGIVVVDIWVDNYGNVTKAVPGGDGTTVLNKDLFNAARIAAMETHFNMEPNAPAMQQGTITYHFNLK